MEHRVELPVFSGPMDLLLHLVKQREVDVAEVSVARLLEDYLARLGEMRGLDLDTVGEFLVLASELMEIKSREMLPREDMDLEEELDPRNDLIRRLLEFKRYRDLARKLDRMARLRERMAGRGMPGADLPAEEPSQDLDLGATDVWALLKAYSRLMAETGFQAEYRIDLQDVPVRVHIQEVLDLFAGKDRLELEAFFPGTEGRAAVVGTFLAILELIRQGHVGVEAGPAGELPRQRVWLLFLGPEGLTGDQVLAIDDEPEGAVSGQAIEVSGPGHGGPSGPTGRPGG